jgi:hypothetical protein
MEGEEETGVWRGRSVEPVPNLKSVGVFRLGEGGGGDAGRFLGGGEEDLGEGGLRVVLAEGAFRVKGSSGARCRGFVVFIVKAVSSSSEPSPRLGIEIWGRAPGRAVPDMFKPSPYAFAAAVAVTAAGGSFSSAKMCASGFLRLIEVLFVAADCDESESVKCPTCELH